MYISIYYNLFLKQIYVFTLSFMCLPGYVIYAFILLYHLCVSPIQRGFAPGFVNYKKGCTWLAAACDKVYQLLAHGQWFSPGTSASSTTKTGRHDIAEILLKVALKHQKSKIKSCMCLSCYVIYVFSLPCYIIYVFSLPCYVIYVFSLPCYVIYVFSLPCYIIYVFSLPCYIIYVFSLPCYIIYVFSLPCYIIYVFTLLSYLCVIFV
jgi:hypothetical protein